MITLEPYDYIKMNEYEKKRAIPILKDLLIKNKDWLKTKEGETYVHLADVEKLMLEMFSRGRYDKYQEITTIRQKVEKEVVEKSIPLKEAIERQIKKDMAKKISQND